MGSYSHTIIIDDFNQSKKRFLTGTTNQKQAMRVHATNG
jgi:hypothetical protein